MSRNCLGDLEIQQLADESVCTEGLVVYTDGSENGGERPGLPVSTRINGKTVALQSGAQMVATQRRFSSENDFRKIIIAKANTRQACMRSTEPYGYP